VVLSEGSQAVPVRPSGKGNRDRVRYWEVGFIIIIIVLFI
jgi:hypothetical protein